MDSLFKHLPFVFCYLDDIIIVSHTIEEHHEHLRQIFTILQENGLQINAAKCMFTTAAVEFLGHRVDQHGVRLLQRHLQAISDFPPPQDVKQLQQFLGMVNFYRSFLPGIPRTLQLLTDTLKVPPRHWSCRRPPPPSERPTWYHWCTQPRTLSSPQLILPGQFINNAESPSPSFLSDLQTTMTGRPPPPTRHNSAPAPSTLPEELLLARFVLVCQDGAQPPLSPIYDGPTECWSGQHTSSSSRWGIEPTRCPRST